MSHKHTWAAIIIAFLLIVPGMLLGGVASWLYVLMTARFFEDSLFDWLTSGWFSKISVTAFSSALQGAVGGWFGIYITSRLLKHANYEIVSYTCASLIILLSIFSVFLGAPQSGWLRLDNIAIFANTLGVIIGLFGTLSSIQNDQRFTVKPAGSVSKA